MSNNSAPVKKIPSTPEDYRPKMPEIVKMALQAKEECATETLVETVGTYCSIVERAETRIVGISVPVSFESQGYSDGNSVVFNDYAIAKKYITDGTISFLAETIGVDIRETEIISARYHVHEDGNYNVVIGVRFNKELPLPFFLPEHTVSVLLPSCRYARIEINEHNREGRIGFDERMHADEYFISDFRQDTRYIFDVSGWAMNTWDETGDILTKYEPVRLARDHEDHFDTFDFQPVLLPPWKVACCVRYPEENDDVSVIGDYFKIQDQVDKTGLNRYYKSDFIGFPFDADGGYASCFGCRVVSFEGLPDCVEKITLPGGRYVHITQKEFNGDNPSMPYDIAFNHMDQLYFVHHPEYEFDHGRKVIARFRQGNCASVFVPVKNRTGEEKNKNRFCKSNNEKRYAFQKG